jgi:hypothetical protein
MLNCVGRDRRAGVLVGETMSVDQLDRLVELSKAAHSLAQTAISTRAAEGIAQRYVDEGGQLGKIIVVVMDRLGLTIGGPTLCGWSHACSPSSPATTQARSLGRRMILSCKSVSPRSP